MSDELSRRLFVVGASGLVATAATPAWAQSRNKRPYLAPGVYVDEIPSGVHTIQAPETSVTLFIDRFGDGEVETVTSIPELLKVAGSRSGVSAAALETVTLYFRNGGRKALIASIDNTSAAAILGAAGGNGVRSLINGPALGVDFICVPPAADLSVGEAANVYSEALLLAVEQKAILLVDAPPSAGFDANDFVLNWRGALGLNNPNAAIYAPRLDVAGVATSLCASAAVAGISARIDIARGVWKAPAGLDASVNGAMPAASLSTADTEALTQANANAIRTFPGRGAMIWGARTMSSDPEWKYVPVRRLSLYIEKSLDGGLDWVVFEPNAEPLWSQLRTTISAYMESLFRQGAFSGSTQREAYFVRCDRSTTTQNDIDNGICNIEIGFAPLKPAEFIILRRALRTAN